MLQSRKISRKSLSSLPQKAAFTGYVRFDWREIPHNLGYLLAAPYHGNRPDGKPVRIWEAVY